MSGLRVGDVVDKAVDGLQADTTLTTLLGGTSKVYVYVPEDTTSPYVQVLGAVERPWAEVTNDDTSREVDLDVDVWSAYRGTKEVDDVSSRCVVTLRTASTWSGLSGYNDARFMQSERPIQELIGNEIWYRRRTTVRVYLGSA